MSPPISREPVFSQVHRHLRDRILRNEFPEGTRLVETSLAAEFKVSRTPVREALILLQGQDLVFALENGGFVVCSVRQQLLDILDIRVALETHAVSKAAARIREEELAELDRICDEMEALPSGAWERRAELNRAFHETLITAAHNQRLVKMVNDYQDYFRTAQPLFDPDAIRQTQIEHRDITEALRRHDADEALHLVAAHISHAGQHIMRNFLDPQDSS